LEERENLIVEAFGRKKKKSSKFFSPPSSREFPWSHAFDVLFFCLCFEHERCLYYGCVHFSSWKFLVWSLYEKVVFMKSCYDQTTFTIVARICHVSRKIYFVHETHNFLVMAEILEALDGKVILK
jgi:hypothetical protein